MDKYIVKSDGEWNIPHIDSKTIGSSNGFIPLYSGGCFAIIPYNDKFILFSEDDDNYWEEETIDKKELLDLQKIYSELDKDIKVTIDYVKAKSTQKYLVSKKDFFNKERSIDKWKVRIIDRGKISPLVYINNYGFDVFHAKARLQVINSILKILEQ